MTGEFAIKLNLSCVLNVPIHSYENNFSFIVNGKEFKTSRIFSDLLSPNISRIHANDPTSDTFIIKTKHQGDFTKILDLDIFNEIRFTEDKLPFISKLAELLGINSIEYGKNNKPTKITIENVFSKT